MLSIGKLSHGMMGYYCRLAREDYYTQGGEPEGIWLPTRGAKLMGLSGTVKKEDLHRLLLGFSPTGEKLVQSAGSPDRQLGWDVTANLSKQYSVFVAMLPPREQALVRSIEHQVTTEIVRHLEEHVCVTRRGHGGARFEPANLIVAAFQQFTSRSLGPHAHTHLIVMNLSYNADGTITSLHSRPLYEYQAEASILYDKTLARRLRQELGLKVTFTGKSFDIPGVPNELCERFSQRRQEILRYLARKGDYSPAAAEEACLKTRKPKKNVPPRDQLIARWQEIGAEYGFSTEQALNLLHRIRPQRRATLDVTGEDQTRPPIHNRHQTPAKPARVAQPSPPGRPFAREPKSPQPNLNPHRREFQAVTPSNRPYAQRRPERSDDATDRASSVGKELAREIASLLPDSTRPRATGNLQAVLRQYAESDSQLHPQRIQRQVDSLHAARRRAIRPAKIKAVLDRYQRARNPLVEECRHHFQQLVRAAMKQKTQPIDRAQIRNDAQVRLDHAHTEAVRSLVSDRSRLSILRRNPSYNSDWVIRVAREVWQRSGYQVLAVSLTRARVRELQTQGLEAMTLRTLELKMDPTLSFRLKHVSRQLLRAALHRHTYTLDPLRMGKKTILIVDAADALNTTQMNYLIHKVRCQRGRIVLVEGASPNPVPNTAFDMIVRQIRHKRDPPGTDAPNATHPDPPKPDREHPRNHLKMEM